MPFINDREVSEEEYQAALKEAAPRFKDDRIIYLAVRHQPEGAFIEGGFNKEFDWLDRDKRLAVITMAMEAVLANAVAILPDDEELRKFFDQSTGLGKKGGPTWGKKPLTPAEGEKHG